MAKEYDVVILGGGTGGYVAAIRASQLGLKAAIVERDKLGGTCLHKGCIPSKALLRSAEIYSQSKKAHSYGVDVAGVTLNFEKVQNRKQQIVEQLYNGVQHLIQKGKIDVYHGTGRILGPSIFSPLPGTISVEMQDGTENEMLIPKNVIVATGSRPRMLDGVDVDGQTILTSDEALQLKTLPKSIIIVGGGVIGIEWASLLADFDVAVTIVEYGEHILPTEDVDISSEMTKLLKRRNIRIFTSAIIDTSTIEVSTKEVTCSLKTGEVLTAEKMLLSIGRTANIENIGLENTEIEIENACIKVNAHFQTKEHHIYAIGDVIGGMQLAHVASYEGIRAVEHIAGLKNEALYYSNIARCVYGNPEIASVGLTEMQAQEQGFETKVAKFPFKAIGKALVYGEAEGFAKVIADSHTNDLLGVHLIGPHATDLISEAALSLFLNATPWEMGATIHPHPSLSEALGEAALAIEGKAIHF
ncbi:dihydrolipoyl dehydrogenase [Lysinibacillus sp. LZ02]|uniref:dihydrolipoyl dehydrogenase n=1 Tax=Lysinibacillus sp. LZ02 TaxID=3420668 RepID=UPI003D36E09F